MILLAHLGGMLVLRRWHRRAGRSGREWHVRTLGFVLGIFSLHLFGAIIFGVAYRVLGAVETFGEALVASISLYAATSPPVEFKGDVNVLATIQGLIGWLALIVSVTFLIGVERGRPPVRANNRHPER